MGNYVTEALNSEWAKKVSVNWGLMTATEQKVWVCKLSSPIAVATNYFLARWIVKHLTGDIPMRSGQRRALLYLVYYMFSVGTSVNWIWLVLTKHIEES